MVLGIAQDENRTNKIASWPDGFTMRAVFDVKKRKSVLKLIMALSLPLFVRLSASAQTTSAEKPSITEKIGLPGHPLPNYKPVTGPERFKWFVKSTVGPSSLFLYGPLSAALGTATNSPEEYGPHWAGLGKRYGMRLTGVSTGNAMEASLGAIWGEDPRYFRSPNRAFEARVEYVISSTFAAPGRAGRFRPAYARFAGNVGNNFLSNTWRTDSEADAGHAALRCLYGVLGKMGSNAFIEFWPDVRKRVFKKK
jgi:hypothetical protein